MNLTYPVSGKLKFFDYLCLIFFIYAAMYNESQLFGSDKLSESELECLLCKRCAALLWGKCVITVLLF